MSKVKITIFYGEPLHGVDKNGLVVGHLPSSDLGNETEIVNSTSSSMKSIVEGFTAHRSSIGRGLIAGDVIVVTEYFQSFPTEGYRRIHYVLADIANSLHPVALCKENTEDVFRTPNDFNEEAYDFSPYDPYLYMGT